MDEENDDFNSRIADLHISPRMRSKSFKRPSKAKIHDNNTILDEMRPRTCSLPARNQYTKYLSPQRANGMAVDYGYSGKRVRSFETNRKGSVINRGDVFRSSTSIVSSNSSLTEEPLSIRLSSANSSTGNVSSELMSSPGLATQLKVAIVGTAEVGKTAVAQQFMTSEYIGGFNASFDVEQEKTVSMMLDGEENQVAFIEMDPGQLTPGAYDAYILVFSLTCRSSFHFAVDCLYLLRKEEGNQSAIILVGNKSDLVRTRLIGNEEARSVAVTYESKYVETSALLNMNIDELLVGVVTQIRLKYKERESPVHRHRKDSRCASPKMSPKVIISKLLCKEPGTKSCENMAVL